MPDLPAAGGVVGSNRRTGRSAASAAGSSTWARGSTEQHKIPDEAPVADDEARAGERAASLLARIDPHGA